MAWEVVKEIKNEDATLWRNRDNHQWEITANRGAYRIEPKNDLNHPTTKKAAFEKWNNFSSKLA